MPGKLSKLIIIFAALPMLAVIGLIVFMGRSPAPPMPLPNPNGYDSFVKARQMLTVPNDYDQLTQDQLRAWLAQNTPALQTARTGLQQKCRVPQLEDYSPTSTSTNQMYQLSGMKALAQALAAEGKVAESENRPADAARSYLDAVRLGNESARGGASIDQMVGTACENIGTFRLQKLAGQLDAKSCRDIAATLESLDAQRQSWNDVLQQEKIWVRRAFPGLRNRIVDLLTTRTTQQVIQKAEQKFTAQQTRTRRLLIDFAVCAYELEKGRRPASLADLVPDYLKAIPLDPATGGPLGYAP